MRRAAARIFLAGILALLPTLGLAQQKLPDNPAVGARIFAEKGCFRCHSILGEGGQVGHDLGRIELGASQMDVATNLLNHAQMMITKTREARVIWPPLSGSEIDSLIAYLYYVHYFDISGDPAKGEKIFASRGCSRCHGITESSSGAPPLPSFPRNISPIFLATALWNHGPAMQAGMKQLGIAWPQFQETEIMDLVAYLKGVARGTSTTAYYAPGNPNNGIQEFGKKGCTRCHGDEAGSARINLSERSGGLKKSMTEVVARMWNHAPQIFSRMRSIGMAVPQFTEKEMADLVAYLYFLNYIAPPPDLAAGRKLFVEKQCATCHSLGGGAQGVGPDLAASKKSDSPTEMAAAMWTHAPFMEPLMRERGISWPRFEKGELNDLFGYIQSYRK